MIRGFPEGSAANRLRLRWTVEGQNRNTHVRRSQVSKQIVFCRGDQTDGSGGNQSAVYQSSQGPRPWRLQEREDLGGRTGASLGRGSQTSQNHPIPTGAGGFSKMTGALGQFSQ